jgi:mannose-6-phosphate isomerase-like protein (cupin superfamily)
MPAPKEAWVSSSISESKPWGETRVWHALSHIHGKLIHIRKGERTSLKYHNVKNEVFFVLSGKIKVSFGNEKTLENSEKHPFRMKVLRPMDVLYVQSECPYRLEALEDSQVIEVGDRVDDVPKRLEDDYGRAVKLG